MKIAVLGTGLMGTPIAEALLRQGHNVLVWNRTISKAKSLSEKGAVIAQTPAEAIQSAECIVVMLSSAEVASEILLSAPSALLLKDRTVIMMSTIGPTESKSICEKVERLGGQYLEAPVLGSIPEAKNSDLIVMVGAEGSLFEKWTPLLKSFGRNPILIGEVGHAATVKIAINQLIGTLTSGFSSALALVLHRGVDVSCYMSVLRESAVYAPTFDKKLKRMLDRDFERPNFPLRHLIKDLTIFMRESEGKDLNASHVAGLLNMLKDWTAEHNDALDKDYSALFASIDP